MDQHYPTPPAPPKYATFVPGRFPNWKYYSNIGHAKNAMYAASYYGRFSPAELWIYDAQSDKWVLAVNTRDMEFDENRYQNTHDQLKVLLDQFNKDTI